MKPIILMLGIDLCLMETLARFAQHEGAVMVVIDDIKKQEEEPKFYHPEPILLKNYEPENYAFYYDEYKYAHTEGWNLPLTTKKHKLKPKHTQFINERLRRFLTITRLLNLGRINLQHAKTIKKRETLNVQNKNVNNAKGRQQRHKE